MLVEDGAKDVGDERFGEGEATIVGWWRGCPYPEGALSRNVVTTGAGAGEVLGLRIIRERREIADPVSEKETIESAVRGRREDDRCTWVGKDELEEAGRERERLDWENREEEVTEPGSVVRPVVCALDTKS